MIRTLAKKYDAKQRKQREFLTSHVAVSLHNFHNRRFLSEIYANAKKRERAFLFNRLNVVREIADNTFRSAVFITLTSNGDVVALAQQNYNYNKVINDNYNKVFRDISKTRYYRRVLNAKNRIYISVNEFTKKLVLHRHFLQYMLDDDVAYNFVNIFINAYNKNRYACGLGRCEIVVTSNVYNAFLRDERFVKLRKKGERILVYNNAEARKNGSYLYIKKMKSDDDVQSFTRYAMKYVMKEVEKNADYNKITLNTRHDEFAKAVSYLHSTLRIRRFNFSRYVFSKSLYYNLKHENTGEHIYNVFTLLQLTHLKNNGDIVVFYNNYKKQKEERDNYNVYMYKKALQKFAYTYYMNIFERNLLNMQRFDALVANYAEQLLGVFRFKNIDDVFNADYGDMSELEREFVEFVENDFIYDDFVFDDLAYVVINGEKYVYKKENAYIVVSAKKICYNVEQ